MRCFCGGGKCHLNLTQASLARPKMSGHTQKGINMLRSYSAELNGSALVWLDQPPPDLKRARVLVVVEEEADSQVSASQSKRYNFAHLAGRLQWSGDAVLAQRESRDAW